MKSYHVSYGGGLESLTLKEHPIPEPGPGQVLVRVHANSFNLRELSILRGNYPLPVKADVVAMSDGAGEVVIIGEGVTRTRKGDRVAIQVFPRWIDGPFAWEYADQIGGSLDGMLTEYALVSEEAVVHIPDQLSYIEAATLPCAALTAWNAVTDGRPIKPGDTVLTLGSGGVSLFALQFAKLAGAKVIATTSDENKAERLRELGADGIVNYRKTPDWHTAVRQLAGGRGVDKVIEIGSGAFENSIRASAMGGEISLIGRSSATSAGSAADTNPNINLLFTSFVGIRPIAIGSRAQFLDMNKAITAHGMKPVIDRIFPFAEARAAYEYYQAGKYFGKVIISHDAD